MKIRGYCPGSFAIFDDFIRTMRFVSPFVILCAVILNAEGKGFPFGEVTPDELRMNVYDKDTAAVAVVLNEFGNAYFYEGTLMLRFEYHVKIKILKKAGLYLSDFSIPLHKYAHTNEMDFIHGLRASSFTLGQGGIVETKLDLNNVHTERYEGGEIKKFAIPNVTEGSVIEIAYQLDTPYIFNFREWTFQREIPKLYSEYWATIPAYYRYNISLVGYLKLSKNEAERVRDCLSQGIDCSRQKFAMNDIPAFVEEEHMTAKKNFLSALNFELAEVHHRTGYVDKVTREWNDVEDELRKDSRFGVQLRRGENVMDKAMASATRTEPDLLKRAMRVYDLIVKHYSWNEEYGTYCEHGIKEAYDEGVGNVADLNLSLIAVLRYAGIQADPVILSTRENGYVTEVFPVLSDFNYVLANISIDGKEYLLDATDPLLPFGMVPFHCLNGKGRLIGDRETSWREIRPVEKRKQTNHIALSFTDEGNLKGSIQNTYLGYDALSKRQEILSFNSLGDYTSDLKNKLSPLLVTNIEVKNLEDPSRPLIEIFGVELDGFSDGVSTLLLNPFLINKTVQNPFRASDRLYPVDFGANIDERITVTLEFPEDVVLVTIPEDVGLSLPNGGGTYVLKTQKEGQKVSIISWLNTSKAIYSREEYYYLKELFGHIVQVQNTDLIFRKE
jgi:hypothetical protein